MYPLISLRLCIPEETPLSESGIGHCNPLNSLESKAEAPSLTSSVFCYVILI